MRFGIAAFFDLYVGRVLLKIISLFPPFPKRLDKRVNPERLLIMKFWGFGSILEATPLCYALKKTYSQARLDLLTFSENKFLAESLDLFDSVHVINMRKGIKSLFFQSIDFILKHRKKYSLVVDLEFFANYSSMVTKLLASKFSLGFDSFFGSRNRCYSRTIIFDHSNHIRVIFLKFLDALGITSHMELALRTPVVPEEKRLSTIGKLSEFDSDQLNIAVNINTSELSINRQWPLENFKNLISLIRNDRPDVKIWLVGSKSDAAAVGAFYDSLPNKNNVFVTAGKLDILEFAFMLSSMTCLITNDSGPLHLAEAVGTPVVSFFGPETHNLYGPLSKDSMVFYKNLYCSPCLNTYNHKRSRCRDNQCLKLIRTEEVYEAVKDKFLQPVLYD